MSETTIYHNRTRCIVDPTLQRKFIVEALSECDRSDMVAHFRFLEARIAKEKLRTCACEFGLNPGFDYSDSL